MTATVTASSGSTVNMRMQADKSSSVVCKVPVGATVVVDNKDTIWSQIVYQNKTGYMMTKYLSFSGESKDLIYVSRSKLQQLYKDIEALLNK